MPAAKKKAGTKPKGKKPKDIELEDGSVKAYCMKCRKKNQKMTDPVLIHMPVSGKWRPAVRGTHKPCGTSLTLFVSQDFVKEAQAA